MYTDIQMDNIDMRAVKKMNGTKMIPFRFPNRKSSQNEGMSIITSTLNSTGEIVLLRR